MEDVLRIIGAVVTIVVLLEGVYLLRSMTPSAIRERRRLEKLGLDENGNPIKEGLSMKVRNGKLHFKKH